MVDALDPGFAGGGESREDERRARAQVARHDGGAGEGIDAVDDGARALNRDVGAHALELRNVHEAVRVDALGDDGKAGGEGHEGAHLGLKVGREARVGKGDDIDALARTVADDADLLGDGVALAADAALFELVDEGAHVAGDDVLDSHVAAGDGARDEEGSGLDAVGQDAVRAAVEGFDTGDLEVVAADALDLGAHLDEHVAEILHFGLAGGAFDARDAGGEGGGHDDVGRAGDGRALTAAEKDVISADFGGIDLDVSGVDADLAAQAREALQVQVDRALADDAAAGHRDAGAAQASDEGPEGADGRAHLAHEFIGGDVADLLGFYLPDARGDLLCARTERAENLSHKADVRKIRDVFDRAFLRCQKAGREDRQRRVLRSTGRNSALQRSVSLNAQYVHASMLNGAGAPVKERT